VAHGAGIGTDYAGLRGFSTLLTAGCTVAVGVALLARLSSGARRRRRLIATGGPA
jgi:hypothetical protein